MERVIEKLKWFLATYHPKYTLDDVEVSECRGYLRCLKPCRCVYPPYDGYTIGVASGTEAPHYHTISIKGIKGFGRGWYAFWRAVKRELEGSGEDERQAEMDDSGIPE